jgi:hypothetical protein
MADRFEIGVDTFGDVTIGSDGTRHTQAHVLRDVVEEAILAEISVSTRSASESTIGLTSRSRRPEYRQPVPSGSHASISNTALARCRTTP